MAGTSLSFLSLSLTSASTSSTPSPSLTPDAPDSVIAMGSSLISNYGSTLQVSESCSFFHFLGFSSLSVSPFDLLDRPRGTEEKIRALLSSLTLSLSLSVSPSLPPFEPKTFPQGRLLLGRRHRQHRALHRRDRHRRRRRRRPARRRDGRRAVLCVPRRVLRPGPVHPVDQDAGQLHE